MPSPIKVMMAPGSGGLLPETEEEAPSAGTRLDEVP